MGTAAGNAAYSFQSPATVMDNELHLFTHAIRPPLQLGSAAARNTWLGMPMSELGGNKQLLIFCPGWRPSTGNGPVHALKGR